jgi:hypothetical protein
MTRTKEFYRVCLWLTGEIGTTHIFKLVWNVPVQFHARTHKSEGSREDVLSVEVP